MNVILKEPKEKDSSAGLSISTMPRLNPTLPISRSELLPLVNKVLSALGFSDRECELSLVGDREIAALNEKFLGCVGPTNVLSFPEQDSAAPQKLGLVVLSVDALTREARLYGQEPRAYLVRLLCHGFLHLAGFGHGLEMDEITDAVVDYVHAC